MAMRPSEVPYTTRYSLLALAPRARPRQACSVHPVAARLELHPCAPPVQEAAGAAAAPESLAGTMSFEVALRVCNCIPMQGPDELSSLKSEAGSTSTTAAYWVIGRVTRSN